MITNDLDDIDSWVVHDPAFKKHLFKELAYNLWQSEYAANRIHMHRSGANELSQINLEVYSSQWDHAEAMIAMYLDYLDKAGIGLVLDHETHKKIDNALSIKEIIEVLNEQA